MRALLKAEIRDETAQTTTEYGLLLGFLALAVVTFLVGIRSNLQGIFDAANTALANADGFVKSTMPSGCGGRSMVACLPGETRHPFPCGHRSPGWRVAQAEEPCSPRLIPTSAAGGKGGAVGSYTPEYPGGFYEGLPDQVAVEGYKKSVYRLVSASRRPAPGGGFG